MFVRKIQTLALFCGIVALAVTGTACGKKGSADVETVVKAMETISSTATSPTGKKGNTSKVAGMSFVDSTRKQCPEGMEESYKDGYLICSSHQSSESECTEQTVNGHTTVVCTSNGTSGGGLNNGADDEVEVFGTPCKQVRPNSSSRSNAFDMKITGDKCAIDFSMSMSQEANSGMSMKFHFAAKTDEAKKASEVSSIDLNFTVLPSKDGMSAKITMLLSAEGKEFGKVGYDLSGEVKADDAQGTSGSGEVTGTITVGEKTADYKEKITLKDGKMASEYYINGEKLTEEQVKRAGQTLVRGQASSSTMAM